jgi:RNA polymerase sigma factor (TIGR02999 family)
MSARDASTGFDASGGAPLEVSVLLAEIQAGNKSAWDALIARVHADLHELAHQHMARERGWHSLQTTALVNEAYVRLVENEAERLENRAHFFGAAARAMRRILVDEARRRRAQKRGGGRLPLSISQVLEAEPLLEGEGDEALDIELLHRALEALEAKPAQRAKSKIVELRFFVGLTNEQAAEVLGVSLATVKRDWEFARAWLRREIDRLGRAS